MELHITVTQAGGKTGNAQKVCFIPFFGFAGTMTGQEKSQLELRVQVLFHLVNELCENSHICLDLVPR